LTSNTLFKSEDLRLTQVIVSAKCVLRHDEMAQKSTAIKLQSNVLPGKIICLKDSNASLSLDDFFRSEVKSFLETMLRCYLISKPAQTLGNPLKRHTFRCSV
jgi:hypothetical protein